MFEEELFRLIVVGLRMTAVTAAGMLSVLFVVLGPVFNG
jgi:hypothetical protein